MELQAVGVGSARWRASKKTAPAARVGGFEGAAQSPLISGVTQTDESVGSPVTAALLRDRNHVLQAS